MAYVESVKVRAGNRREVKKKNQKRNLKNLKKRLLTKLWVKGRW